MKEKVAKIREAIQKCTITSTDEPTILSLRIIELLEQLNEIMEGKEYGKWLDAEPRIKRVFVKRRKPGPKRKSKSPRIVGVGSKGGEFGRRRRRYMADKLAAGLANGENVGELQGSGGGESDTGSGDSPQVIPERKEGNEQVGECPWDST
jgi:hypothetical protein